MDHKIEEDLERLPLKSGCTVTSDAERHFSTSIDTAVIHSAGAEHQEYLNETLKKVSKLLGGGFSFGLTYASATAVFVLYARTFYNNSTIIGIVVYLYYIVSGILSWIYANIGHKWRFDYLFIILSIIDVVAFSLLAFGDNFVLLSIGFILCGQPLEAVQESFALLLLPVSSNQKFQVNFVSIFMLGFLLGPVMAAIVSYYVNYRAVYCIDVSICVLLLLYNVVSFWNIEEELLNKQLTMQKYYNMVDSNYNKNDNDNNNNNKKLYGELISKNEHLQWIVNKEYRFGICNDGNYNKNNNMYAYGSGNKKDDDWHLNFLLTLVLINDGLFIGCEGALGVYFAPYMTDRFNSDKLNALLPLGLVCIFDILGLSVAEVIGAVVEKKKTDMKSITNGNSNYNNNTRIYKFTLCHLFIICSLLSLSIAFIMALIIFPSNIFNINRNSLIIEYYCLMPIYGFMFGVPFMCNELIFIELIPPSKIGSIIGIKILIEYVMRGICILIVALLWDSSYDWLWYTQACIVGIAMVNFLTMGLLEMGHGRV